MNDVKRFEDLIAWQIARELVRLIYEATRGIRFSKDLKLSGQIQSAAVSITSNIAEGFERGSPADFHKFIVMAKASCAEVRSQLYNAQDIGYLSEEEFNKLFALTDRVGRLVGGLRESIRDRIRAC